MGKESDSGGVKDPENEAEAPSSIPKAQQGQAASARELIMTWKDNKVGRKVATTRTNKALAR
jgi:hypothetical protein